MTFFRYLAIQVLAYGVDVGVFLLVLKIAPAEPIVANAIAKCTAGGFAFVAHRRFTFGVSGADSLGRQATRYVLLLAANVPIASAILAVTLLWLPMPLVAKFLADVACVAISYMLSKYFIFGAKSNRSGSFYGG